MGLSTGPASSIAELTDGEFAIFELSGRNPEEVLGLVLDSVMLNFAKATTNDHSDEGFWNSYAKIVKKSIDHLNERL